MSDSLCNDDDGGDDADVDNDDDGELLKKTVELDRPLVYACVTFSMNSRSFNFNATVLI